MVTIRKATIEDIPKISAIYDAIHTAEEDGRLTIGWARGVYPVRQTAEDALNRDDLFVALNDDSIVGAAIINQIQVDVYEGAPWKYPAAGEEVMVLHTLVIDPAAMGLGAGRTFVDFYEKYALSQGCHYLRMDTNARNVKARRLYKRLDYDEIGIVPCVFNGIDGVQLVLLEKLLEKKIRNR